MYGELKQVFEIGLSIKANPVAILASLAKAIYADEVITNDRLMKLCGVSRTTLFRNKRDVLHISMVQNATAVFQNETPTFQNETREKKEKAEKENPPCTPLKEEKKEKEQQPPKSPTGDLATATATAATASPSREEILAGLPDVWAKARAEALGEEDANYPYAAAKQKPATQKVEVPAEDDAPVTEENKILDFNDFKAFRRIYPKKGDFRPANFNRLKDAWNTAITHGFKGEHLVLAVETAKSKEIWKAPDGTFKYAPGAINFLEEEQAIDFLPKSYDPEANIKNDKPQNVKWADVEIDI